MSASNATLELVPESRESTRTRPFRILAEAAEADRRVITEGLGDCTQALDERDRLPIDTTTLALEAQAIIQTYRVTEERYNQASYRYSRMSEAQREKSRSWIVEIRSTYQKARDEYRDFMKTLIRDAATWRAYAAAQANAEEGGR